MFWNLLRQRSALQEILRPLERSQQKSNLLRRFLNVRPLFCYERTSGSVSSRWSMSIYSFTKQRLINLGVDSTAVTVLTLTNKKLFLLFVNLERACRSKDFDSVYNRVREIDEYTKTIGKRELLYFAYRYLRFTGNMSIKYEILPPTGRLPAGIKYEFEYRPAVDLRDIALVEWAQDMADRHSKHFWRALFQKDRTAE